MGNHNNKLHHHHSTTRVSNEEATVQQQYHHNHHHPLVKPLALNLLNNCSGELLSNQRGNVSAVIETTTQPPWRMSNVDNEGNNSTLVSSWGRQNMNGRQLLVDFHASAKTPRHVRTIIDDEEDDNVEESFFSLLMTSNDHCENPPSSIPIITSHTQPPTSPNLVSPDCENKKTCRAANSSFSPKKKQALKLLAIKIKNKFHNTEERTSTTNRRTTKTTLQQTSLSDSALSSVVSCNIQQSSSSSLLKIDSHRSLQSHTTTNISSNNNSSNTLITNGQTNQKSLKMNEDGEYVDEDTYSNSSESLDVSESEQGDEEDYIEQFIQGTMVQTIDDSISYLKHSMRNQLA